MTLQPKEKAQNLTDYMYGETKHTLRSYQDAWSAAKQCAIICCNEIIDGIASIIGDQKHMWSSHEAKVIKDYKDVIAEIEKM